MNWVVFLFINNKNDKKSQFATIEDICINAGYNQWYGSVSWIRIPGNSARDVSRSLGINHFALCIDILSLVLHCRGLVKDSGTYKNSLLPRCSRPILCLTGIFNKSYFIALSAVLRILTRVDKGKKILGNNLPYLFEGKKRGKW